MYAKVAFFSVFDPEAPNPDPGILLNPESGPNPDRDVVAKYRKVYKLKFFFFKENLGYIILNL